MEKSILLSGIQNIATLPSHFKKYLHTKGLPESVYFYTFHKCASTLFSNYVLKHVEGLEHVDYASRIYAGESFEKLVFNSRGYVYGPIRLSAGRNSPVYKMLITPTSKNEFIRDKTAIFLVRDPRDILVSAYYSIGYTHGMSPVKEIRDGQEVIRKKIQEKSIDEYVLSSANIQAENFNVIYELASACDRGVIVKYEDMINDFEYFISQFCTHINIDENHVKEIYKASRPKEKEDKSSHRRSGKAGDFRNKLKEETIVSLNRTLNDALLRFGYEE